MRWLRRRPEPEPETESPEGPTIPGPELEPHAPPAEPFPPTEPLVPDEPVEFPPARAPVEFPGVELEGSLDAGLSRSRGGFMSRLRGMLGRTGEDPAVWDDVEETLIAGDVGGSLAMEIVERARARRDAGGAEAAVRAELAAHLVPRDPD